MRGAEKHVRVAMVQAGEQVWFFRVVGATDAVAAESADFELFLKSVQFK